MSFFQEESTRDLLQKFIVGSRYTLKDDNLFKITRAIIVSIYNNPQIWDENCKFNRDAIGNTFISFIANFDFENPHPDVILQLFVNSYRFLYECCFSIGSISNLESDMYQIFNSIKEQVLTDNYSGINISSDTTYDVSLALKYTVFVMPAEINRKFLKDEFFRNENYTIFRDFDKKSFEAEEKIKKWNTELDSKCSKVDELQNKLDSQREGFNFVGLYDGFRLIMNDKKKELRNQQIILLILGSAILYPFFDTLYLNPHTVFDKELFDLSNLFIFIPVMSLEIILIYFFRVVLFNFKSVKTQILQIQLRQALCQFIQNYVDYSVEINNKNKGLLDKFESLIFSNILADSEKLPSTFDGLENLVNLIKNINKTKE